MKKTKQTFFRPLPTEQQNVGISGCKQFQGEDLKYDARRQFFKNKQKQWLDQQIQEKRQREQQQKYQNQLYSNQTFQLNRMRGMLQDNFQQTKVNLVSDLKKTNQQLDLQRKQKERLQKEARLQYERQQAELLKQRGAKQGFYMEIVRSLNKSWINDRNEHIITTITIINLLFQWKNVNKKIKKIQYFLIKCKKSIKLEYLYYLIITQCNTQLHTLLPVLTENNQQKSNLSLSQMLLENQLMMLKLQLSLILQKEKNQMIQLKQAAQKLVQDLDHQDQLQPRLHQQRNNKHQKKLNKKRKSQSKHHNHNQKMISEQEIFSVELSLLKMNDQNYSTFTICFYLLIYFCIGNYQSLLIQNFSISQQIYSIKKLGHCTRTEFSSTFQQFLPQFQEKIFSSKSILK